MGLDQYMMKRNGNLTSGDTDEVDVIEIAYWRKRRHIQNWMEKSGVNSATLVILIA